MFRVAEGVWQLTGFPRDMINAYLVNDVLIDAGTRWARRRFLKHLRNHPLRLVALTHCHPDHQGTAQAICRTFAVPLACHTADVPAMEGLVPMQPDNRMVRFAHRLWGGPPHPVRQILHEGDDIAGFRVVHAPGHTSGHVIFFRQADRVCIAGDVLSNIHFVTRRTGLRLPPTMSCTDPHENRRSVDILAGLKPAVVCFGHGPPLRNPEVLERFIARPRE
jgi:hydroxyacylglutathione hydrolase